MVFDQDGKRLVVSVLADKPTRALWQQAVPMLTLLTPPHRGVSLGETYKTIEICNKDGHIWRIDGTLQLQSFLISTVASAIAEATMEPIK